VKQQRGSAFLRTKGTDWSCATCHTLDPREPGRHTVTGKPIEPMAPAVNSRRFTNAAKVVKWFKRNCKGLLDRECTALEKSDVITFVRLLGP
jgi:hypothetical protein